MLKRNEIQVLRRTGDTLEEVVKLAGVSQSSAQRADAEHQKKPQAAMRGNNGTGVAR